MFRKEYRTLIDNSFTGTEKTIMGKHSEIKVGILCFSVVYKMQFIKYWCSSQFSFKLIEGWSHIAILKVLTFHFSFLLLNISDILILQSQPPPEHRVFDIYQKFKHSLNLLVSFVNTGFNNFQVYSVCIIQYCRKPCRGKNEKITCLITFIVFSEI